MKGASGKKANHDRQGHDAEAKANVPVQSKRDKSISMARFSIYNICQSFPSRPVEWMAALHGSGLSRWLIIYLPYGRRRMPPGCLRIEDAHVNSLPYLICGI